MKIPSLLKYLDGFAILLGQQPPVSFDLWFETTASNLLHFFPFFHTLQILNAGDFLQSATTSGL